MKFKVKDMDISSGGILIAVLNISDAQDLDLHSGDRIILKHKKREITAILDISESDKAVPSGKIGLFEEVLDKLKVKSNSEVTISFSGKPESVKYIRSKLMGEDLDYKQFYQIMDDITNDRLTDIEKTYFVSAGFINGFTDKETVDMTKAIVNTGDKINFNKLTLDKHCIGGVPNNRTSMIIIPIVASLGLTMPKTSSRAITSPAGTADTMECLAKVELSQNKIKEIVKKTSGCIVHGGSMNLAPADDKIILVEHPLSIDAEGQLLASVMAKKYSVSSNHVLIDIPMGETVKVKNKSQAKYLRKKFEKLGHALGMDVKVIVTDGSQPIGNGIGPLLEAEDVLAILRNDPLAPLDLREKSLEMAGILLEMAGKTRNGYKLAQDVLDSGDALIKMREIIKAQGKVKKPSLGKFRYQVRSGKIGKIISIDSDSIAKIARIAGAPIDKGAGLYLHQKSGKVVRKGELLFTIYSQNKDKLDLAIKIMRNNHPYLIK